MRRLLAAAAMLAMAACQTAPPRPVEAAKPEPPKAERARGIVELDDEQQKQANLKLHQIQSRSLPQSIQATGRITMNETRTWRVGAVVEGRVLRVLVMEGDRVEKGQRLAGMHSHEIHEARSNYRKSRTEIARATAEVGYAGKQLDRAKRLYDLKAASLEQVEHAAAELRNAQSAVTQAETEASRHRQHIVEVLELPLEESPGHKDEAEHDDDLIPIKAPASGIVVARKVTAGSVASPGEELFTISDLTSLWMIAAVHEEHLGKLRVGMTTGVQVRAYPERRFTGRISKFGEQFDAGTRTVPVRVELANAAGLLKPEMYATAEIQAGGTREAIFIPQSSVQQVNGHSAVFVALGDGKFELRAIQSGGTEGGNLEILEGLHAGESVVTQGSYLLKSQLLKSTLADEE